MREVSQGSMMPESCQRGTEPAQICVTSEREAREQALKRLVLIAEEDEFGAAAMGVDEGLVVGRILETGIVRRQERSCAKAGTARAADIAVPIVR